MAEQEIINHMKKSIQVLQSNDAFFKKLKSFFLEIFIIVFAITVSIWFHSWEKHHEDQKKVDEFLVDLSQDLTKDSADLEFELNVSKALEKDLTLLLNLTPKQLDSIAKKDTADVKFYPNYVFRKTNNTNYESFKFSGNIGLIENKKIKNLIISYYQIISTFLNETETLYNNRILILNDKNSNYKKNVELVKNTEIKSSLVFISQLTLTRIQIYEELLKNIKEIKKEIHNKDI